MKNDDNFTALHIATENGHTGVVTLLLENGANPDIKDSVGYSALFIASLKDSKKIEDILLENGATPLNSKEKQEVLNKKLLNACG